MNNNLAFQTHKNAVVRDYIDQPRLGNNIDKFIKNKI